MQRVIGTPHSLNDVNRLGDDLYLYIHAHIQRSYTDIHRNTYTDIEISKERKRNMLLILQESVLFLKISFTMSSGPLYPLVTDYNTSLTSSSTTRSSIQYIVELISSLI